MRYIYATETLHNFICDVSSCIRHCTFKISQGVGPTFKKTGTSSWRLLSKIYTHHIRSPSLTSKTMNQAKTKAHNNNHTRDIKTRRMPRSYGKVTFAKEKGCKKRIVKALLHSNWKLSCTRAIKCLPLVNCKSNFLQ